MPAGDPQSWEQDSIDQPMALNDKGNKRALSVSKMWALGLPDTQTSFNGEGGGYPKDECLNLDNSQNMSSRGRHPFA